MCVRGCMVGFGGGVTALLISNHGGRKCVEDLDFDIFGYICIGTTTVRVLEWYRWWMIMMDTCVTHV